MTHSSLWPIVMVAVKEHPVTRKLHSKLASYTSKLIIKWGKTNSHSHLSHIRYKWIYFSHPTSSQVPDNERIRQTEKDGLIHYIFFCQSIILPSFTPSPFQPTKHTYMRSNAPGSGCPTLALACASKEFQYTYKHKREMGRKGDKDRRRRGSERDFVNSNTTLSPVCKT